MKSLQRFAPQKCPRIKHLKGRKAKGKNPQMGADTKENQLDNVPLDRFRLVEDECRTESELFIAVYSFVKQWLELRHKSKAFWPEVAYCGINTVTAGALPSAAIEVLKHTRE